MTVTSIREHLLSKSGQPAAVFGPADWRKSRYSNSQGNCVEFAQMGHDVIGVRDSKDPEGPALTFTKDEIAELFKDIRSGNCDYLLEKV